MGKLKTIWTDVHSSLWFVPAIFMLAGSGLAFGLVELDSRLKWDLGQRFPRFFGVSAEGSRELLSAIASSMIAVAGVSFSITIVSLSLAATQYTSRVLRNFMRDRTNQATLGSLVGVFVYCLIVLRTIRSGEESFVPSTAVMGAILFGICGIVMLIYFLHHIASAVQVSTMLDAITRETIAVLKSIYPEATAGGETEYSQFSDPPEVWRRAREWRPIAAVRSGFIQKADLNSLLKCAERFDLIVRMEYAAGDFVVKGNRVISILGTGPPESKIVRKLNRSIGINSYRSIEQDPAFGIRQIVDIAVKALSPGINDPTTAVSCVGYLGVILEELVGRQCPSPCRYEKRKLRLIFRERSFEFLVDLMFDEIRQHSRDTVPVMQAMLSNLERASHQQMNPARREVLRKHACLIRDHAKLHIKHPHDLEWLANGQDVLSDAA